MKKKIPTKKKKVSKTAHKKKPSVPALTSETPMAVKRAREWVLESSIQSMVARSARDPWGGRAAAPGSRSDLEGSFYSWFDMEVRQSRYVYPEITGYGITTLLYLDALDHDGDLLKRARLAGDWVLNHALEEGTGGVPPRDFYDQKNPGEHFSAHKHVLVTFDSGMVLAGMAHLYESTQHTPYLEGARRIADFLIDEGQKKDGLFYACYEPATKKWTDTPEKWSTQSGSYHAKLALGLMQLHRVTGDDKYKKATENICHASLKLQLPSGRFVTFRKDKNSSPHAGGTHQHPHMYSAEGLITAGVALNEPKFIKSAARAVIWSLDQQLPDGGVPCIAGPASKVIKHQRSDTLAQTLRMASLCHGLGELPARYKSRLVKLERKLLSYQYGENDLSPEHTRGGFAYGAEMDGTHRPHLNFWCTAFALQGLATYRNIVQKGALTGFDNPDLNYLI